MKKLLLIGASALAFYAAQVRADQILSTAPMIDGTNALKYRYGNGYIQAGVVSGGLLTIQPSQLPAIGGDVSGAAGTAIYTVNTVKGKTVLPVDGSVPMIGNFIVPGISMTAPASQLVLPTGNSYPTFVGFNMAITSVLPFGYAAQPGQTRRSSREWGAVVTMVDQTGGYPYALGSPQSLADPSDKVALYTGMVCKAGGGPCWNYNSSLDILSGFAAGGGHGATGSEIDISDQDVDSGGGDGAAGMVDPGYYGLAITGVGQYAATAAISIGGPGDHAIFHRGLVDSGNAVDQCLICEYGAAYRVVDARGTGFAALDTSKGTYSFAVYMKNGQYIAALASGGGTAQLLTLGSDTRVKLAPGGATGVDVGVSMAITGALSTTGSIVAGAQSQFSNGSFSDPGPGLAYDAKFGGGGAGIAVGGASRFNGGLILAGLATALPGGSTVKGTPCVASDGTLYVKTTSGACL